MINITFKIILFFLFFNFINLSAYTNLDTGGVRTILKKTPTKTPIQLMKESSNNNQYQETELPKSEFNYLPYQDSAFYQIIRLNLPVNVILQNNLIYSDEVWNFEKRIQEGTPWQIAIQNIRNIPSSFYNPSPVEIAHRQTMIQNAFEVPFVMTLQQFGLKITTEAIANFFGLSEDLSPKISYSLDYNADVEIVVYSVSSVVVATLFNGRQSPGNYSLTWNGRDSNGRLMPAGDYIAEVRIGKEKYIRKRIVIR